MTQLLVNQFGGLLVKLLTVIPMVLITFLSVPVIAAEPAVKTMSDSELRQIAEEELKLSELPTSAAATAHGTVTATPFVLASEKTEMRSRTDLDFGVQRYQAQGLGTVVGTESYALEQLGTNPMALLGFQNWFVRRGRSESNYLRTGLRFEAGYTSSSMQIVTSSGSQFRDVRFRSIPITLSPTLDYVVAHLPTVSVGAVAGFGELFTVQNGSSSVTNNSSHAAFWQAGPYARWEFAKSAALRLAYTRRELATKKSDLGIQQNNVSLMMGVSL